MRKCHSCHRSTFDSAKFCHHCGAKMTTDKRNCPACQHENVADAKFCQNCGCDFSTPTSPSPPSPKKRSIFDDIEAEKEQPIERSENEEEELELTNPFTLTEENAVNEADNDQLEEELELVFSNISSKTEPEDGNQSNAADEMEDADIDNQNDEISDDTLEFIFEKTPDEIVKPKFNKANIPFEIVENLSQPDTSPPKEEENFEILTKTETETETEENTSKEIIEEEILEARVFEKIIHTKEQQESEKDDLAEEETIEELKLKTPPPINDLFEENPNHNIEEEIFKKFAKAFEKQIKTEQNPTKYNNYVDRFEASDFKLSFEFRVKQLAEEIQKIRQSQSILKDEKALLNQAFTELIDYFIIRYCDDLNQVQLSEKILQYQNIAPENIDLSAMILEYLDFDNENEQVDFDFIKMPMKRLKNASKNFLFPEKGEKIFFICDQSILGSGKEGFAMTEKAIYWKMQFEPAQRVYYKKLQTVEREKEWININEMFFNANPSLNIKMMKLLKKLKWMR